VRAKIGSCASGHARSPSYTSGRQS
jgi:hypothetical protein